LTNKVLKVLYVPVVLIASIRFEQRLEFSLEDREWAVNPAVDEKRGVRSSRLKSTFHGINLPAVSFP